MAPLLVHEIDPEVGDASAGQKLVSTVHAGGPTRPIMHSVQSLLFAPHVQHEGSHIGPLQTYASFVPGSRSTKTSAESRELTDVAKAAESDGSPGGQSLKSAGVPSVLAKVESVPEACSETSGPMTT